MAVGVVSVVVTLTNASPRSRVLNLCSWRTLPFDRAVSFFLCKRCDQLGDHQAGHGLPLDPFAPLLP